MKWLFLFFILLFPAQASAEKVESEWVSELEMSCSKDANGNLPRNEPNRGCTCLALGFVSSDLARSLRSEFGERYINEFLQPLVDNWDSTVDKLANEEKTSTFGNRTLSMTFDISRSCMKQLSGPPKL